MLIPLRNYSNYSICESNIKVGDLVEFASQNKLVGVARREKKCGAPDCWVENLGRQREKGV